MDFDWLTIHVDKINTLQEWTSLLFVLSIVAGAVWYVLNKKKTDAIQKIDSDTISSYKNALEGTRIDLQTQLDHCSSQHKESQDQLIEQNKKIAGLEGEVKTLREIPLAEMAKGIDSIVITNGKILDTLKASAVTLVRDTADAKLNNQTIKEQNVEHQTIKGEE